MKSVFIKPRFSETDAIGHINNTTIPIWFEAARIEYLEEICGGKFAFPLILATQTIDYVKETFFGSDVEIKIAVTRIGNSSFTVACRMYQKGELTVRATGVLVYVNTDRGGPTPLPEEARTILAAEIESDWA